MRRKIIDYLLLFILIIFLFLVFYKYSTTYTKYVVIKNIDTTEVIVNHNVDTMYIINNKYHSFNSYDNKVGDTLWIQK